MSGTVNIPAKVAGRIKIRKPRSRSTAVGYKAAEKFRRTAHALAAVAVALGAVAYAPHANATPLEDEPGWSCVDDGNHVCGPGNAEGKPAGCYDDGGVMVAPWPCYVVVDPATGEGDVYTPGRH